MGFHALPFKLSETPNDQFQLEVQFRFKLSSLFFVLAHILTNLFNFLFTFKASLIDNVAIDGNQITRIALCVITFPAGAYTYSFTLYKSDELTTFVNILFNIDVVKISRSVVFNCLFFSTAVPKHDMK